MRICILRSSLAACLAVLAACAVPPAAPPPPARGAEASASTHGASPAKPAEKAPAKQAASSAATVPKPEPTHKAPTPATPPAKPQPKVASAAPAPAPAAKSPAPAPLDLKALEERLKDTNAIGLLTKLSLKNQVDDLVAEFRAYHKGARPPTLSQLRPAFELLLMKVLSLLQDRDPALAHDVGASRDALWAVLSDPRKLAEFS